jgi:hypothetical protein
MKAWAFKRLDNQFSDVINSIQYVEDLLRFAYGPFSHHRIEATPWQVIVHITCKGKLGGK